MTLKLNKKAFQHSVCDMNVHRTWIPVLLFVAIFGLAYGSVDFLDDKRIGNNHLRRSGKLTYIEKSHGTRQRNSKESGEARKLAVIDQSRSTISLDEIGKGSSNKVSLDEMNAKIDSQEKKEMILQNTLVTVKISPVESLLEDSKERISIFQRGYLEFLNKLFAGASTNEYARVNVSSVNVVHSEFDKFSDHTANVVCQIYTSCESSLSEYDLSNLISEISDKWSSRILELWTGIEETKLSETPTMKGVNVGEDAIFFGLLQKATIGSSRMPSETKSESNSKNESNIVLVFGLSFGAVLLGIIGMFATKKYINHRGSSEYDRERKNGFYSVAQDPNTNLHELDEITLTPTRSILASTMEQIGNLSPFQVPKDAALDEKIKRFDRSRKPVDKYKAPSKKSSYNLILSETDHDESLRNHCECWAPPGKLGVAIDTIDNKPVVHRVKDDSPLKGIIAEQDIILAIDDTDTTHMSAADVTYLMVKRMKNERKITFIKSNTVQFKAEQ